MPRFNSILFISVSPYFLVTWANKRIGQGRTFRTCLSCEVFVIIVDGVKETRGFGTSFLYERFSVLSSSKMMTLNRIGDIVTLLARQYPKNLGLTSKLEIDTFSRLRREDTFTFFSIILTHQI